MSDLLDAPGLKSPNMDVRVDITDIFAFQNPADPTRSVLAMSLYRSVLLRSLRMDGLHPPGETCEPLETGEVFPIGPERHLQ